LALDFLPFSIFLNSSPFYIIAQTTGLIFDLNQDFPIFSFISKLVDQIFDESLPRARKERQIAPQALYRAGAGQASAGDPLSINSLPAIRKAQRGRDKKAPEK